MPNPLRLISRALGAAVLSSAALLSACGGSSGGSSPDAPYSTMHVFGDSLSDTGNSLRLSQSLGLYADPPPGSYSQGRFSNGAVAVEYLWRALSGGHENAAVVPALKADGTLTVQPGPHQALTHAFGGARTGGTEPGPSTPDNYPVPGLRAQVETYASAVGTGGADARALYVVWAGSNDYVFGLADPSAAPVDPELLIGQVVGNVATAIRTLYDRGARHFLVPTLPDFGSTPFFLGRPDLEAMAPLMSQLAEAHNRALGAALDEMAAALPGIQLHRADVFSLLRNLYGSGQWETRVPGLTQLPGDPAAAACLFTGRTSCPTVPLETPLPNVAFWDVIHPTTAVHARIAETMQAALGR